MIALLCYPKSGSDWVKFIIETVTGRSVPNVGKRESLKQRFGEMIGDATLGADVDVMNPAAIKAHYVYELRNVDCHGMVLLVRDPLEVIPSYMSARAGKDPAELVPKLTGGDVRRDAELWGQNLAAFRQVTGPALLVRYEDLIAPSTEPNTITALADFFGGDASLILDDLKRHRKTCLKAKNRGGLKINTQGKGGPRFAPMLADETRDAILETISRVCPWATRTRPVSMDCKK